MRTRSLIVLLLIGLMFVAACDSDEAVKYLKFKSEILLPQAPIGGNYDFTFTVTYGEDKWDVSTGYLDSEIIWGFDNWMLNGSTKTAGPANMTFSEGKITGTPDAVDGGLWSFDVTIQLGKKFVVEKYYLPITQNIEIFTASVLPVATTEVDYIMYFDANFGKQPYYWSFGNWTKNGTPVNDAPIGLSSNGSGYISGLIAHSEAGTWTFDATVFDTSVPNQLSTTKTFELTIKLKISVPTNYPTIQAAVDFANEGEIIYLEAGTLKGPGNRDVNFGGKTLTILGNPQDPSSVIMDCEATSSDPHRAFYFNSGEENCVIDGFTIINCSAKIDGSYWYGGAIFMGSNIDLTIQNVNFKDIITKISTSGYIYGGLIYSLNQCELTLKNVNVENVETTVTYSSSSYYVYGQLIYNNDSSVLNMENCNFNGGYGDANRYYCLFYLYYSEYNFKNVTISNFETTTNYYMYNYGMFYLYYTSGTWENVNVVNNKFGFGKSNSSTYSYGYNYGYGYWYYNDIVLKNCVFANNEFGSDDPSDTYWYLYGIYMYRGTSKWTDCVFACNVTDTTVAQLRPYAVAMQVYYNEATFDRCHFVNNRAPSTYPLSYTPSYSYGGVINVYYGNAVLNDCVFAHNQVGVGSGAIQAGPSMTCVVNNCTFYKNQGYQGGVLYFYYAPIFNNCVMWENTATGGGNVAYGYSSSSYQVEFNNSLYDNSGGAIAGAGSVNPVSCVNSDPYFKDTGDNPVTGDCTFSADTMTVTGTPGTSAFLSEIKRGDGIYLTSDGELYALFVLEVVSDSELKVAGYYKGTPGTGVATVKKLDFNLQHTSKGDANDSPCIDSGDNSKCLSTSDIAGNSRIVDGNADTTATIDMGAYELQ